MRSETMTTKQTVKQNVKDVVKITAILSAFAVGMLFIFTPLKRKKEKPKFGSTSKEVKTIY